MEYSHGKSFQILNDFDKCREPEELFSELIKKKNINNIYRRQKRKKTQKYTTKEETNKLKAEDFFPVTTHAFIVSYVLYLCIFIFWTLC